MENTVVRIENLKKEYGSTVAVDEVSFTIRKGEIFGIIGANGAGKTTTLEIMMGLRKPDSGKVEIIGVDVMKHPEKIKQRIGIQLQQTSLYDRIKVNEALDLFGSYYKKTRDKEEIIQKLGLKPYLNKYVKKLSGGWQQRIALALALINDPEIIFLDEPTTGLDPQARRDLWKIIIDMKGEGKSIVLSTHYMDEVHRYCNRVAVLKNGALVACEEPNSLINKLDKSEGTMDDVYIQLAVNSEEGIA